MLICTSVLLLSAALSPALPGRLPVLLSRSPALPGRSSASPGRSPALPHHDISLSDEISTTIMIPLLTYFFNGCCRANHNFTSVSAGQGRFFTADSQSACSPRAPLSKNTHPQRIEAHSSYAAGQVLSIPVIPVLQTSAIS